MGRAVARGIHDTFSRVTAPIRALHPGQTVAGRYVIERELGKGGHGVVCAARDAQLQRIVALKVLNPSRALSAEAAARFEREARICAQLTSEHVAAVFDAGTDAALGPFVVLELLEGSDLAAVVKEHGPAPIAQASLWLMQACDALAEAHALGVVHRDVKPSNLFLARGPGASAIKVLDFGIARFSEDEETLTATGGRVGTPRYMSPEQLAGRSDVDARSDIWSLGVTLYELCTGSPIFDAQGSASFGALVLTAPPVLMRERLPSVPAALESLVQTCLQKDPARRFPSVLELVRALAPFAPPEGARLVDCIAARGAGVRGAALASPGAPGASQITAPTASVLPHHLAPLTQSHAPPLLAPSLHAPTMSFGPPQRPLAAHPTSHAPLVLGLTLGSVVLAGAAFAYVHMSGSSTSTPPAADAAASASAAQSADAAASVTSAVSAAAAIASAPRAVPVPTVRPRTPTPAPTAPPVAPASSTPTCAPPRVLCGGNHCVDLQLSPMHCGYCFHACPDSRLCANGNCLPMYQ